MKVASAVKKLEKNGFEVTENRGNFFAIRGNKVINFFRNGGGDEITCIGVRNQNDHDDPMTDYYAGVFVDSITKAIRIAQ